jgi:hypothetical protein
MCDSHFIAFPHLHIEQNSETATFLQEAQFIQQEKK